MKIPNLVHNAVLGSYPAVSNPVGLCRGAAGVQSPRTSRDQQYCEKEAETSVVTLSQHTPTQIHQG